MNLSEYARQVGVTYQTAYQWWRTGQLDVSHRPTGTIIVREPETAATGAALDARVSSVEQQADVTRQLQRLRGGAVYQVVAEVTEIASGLNDEQPKLKKLLADARIGVLVVDHKNRLTHLGYGNITTLLEHGGRRVEAIYPSDSGDDLVDDLVAAITSMAVRLYGRCKAKRRAAQIQACGTLCLE